MKKKKGGEGGANWMDTYGDMVTLLLCFFVLLYSISTISEENWKALVMSFNPNAVATSTETPGGDGPNADADQAGGPTMMGMTQEEVDQEIEELYQALQEYISQEGAQNSISAVKENGVVYVSFNQAVFFDGEQWSLREDSTPVLDTIGNILSKASDSINSIRIQGHTAQGDPNRPNNPTTDRFLASNRATIVTVYIQEHSELDPAKLTSEGQGQWHPIASNDTEEGRTQNRRVEMIISGRNIEEEVEGIRQYDTH